MSLCLFVYSSMDSRGRNPDQRQPQKVVSCHHSPQLGPEVVERVSFWQLRYHRSRGNVIIIHWQGYEKKQDPWLTIGIFFFLGTSNLCQKKKKDWSKDLGGYAHLCPYRNASYLCLHV